MNQKLMRQLEKWLEKPGNSKAKLAAKLGYSSSVTITKWFLQDDYGEYRGFPEWRAVDVERLLQGGD